MATPTLRTVTRTQGNNRALTSGEIEPIGYRLEFDEVPILVHGFRRMVRELAYDVCEMAITTYLCAREHGVPFTALPIFLVRGFHHGAILQNTGAGLDGPWDLEGRRVGVNRGYTVTTGVWARGILADEYGVDLDRVTWVLSGDEHVASYRPPPNVVPAPEGREVVDLLEQGELVAGVGLKSTSPMVTPLIPDPQEAALRAFEERGLYPINHLVVVRDELLAEHAELGVSLFEAFAASKERYLRQLGTGSLPDPTPTDRLNERLLASFGDPYPYGIDSNRAMLEELIRHARRQGILRRDVAVDAAFDPATRDLNA
jgi:4,5-dihydroxyphthalate decarboxylase